MFEGNSSDKAIRKLGPGKGRVNSVAMFEESVDWLGRAHSMEDGEQIAHAALYSGAMYEWSMKDAATHSSVNWRSLVNAYYEKADWWDKVWTTSAPKVKGVEPKYAKLGAKLKEFQAGGSRLWHMGHACAHWRFTTSSDLAEQEQRHIKKVCGGGSFRLSSPLWGGAFKRENAWQKKSRSCLSAPGRLLTAAELAQVVSNGLGFESRLRSGRRDRAAHASDGARLPHQLRP